VNLLANRPVVPELWHLPVRAEDVSAALRPLLDPASGAHQVQRQALAGVRSALGRPGASRRVAQLVLDRVGP